MRSIRITVTHEIILSFLLTIKRKRQRVRHIHRNTQECQSRVSYRYAYVEISAVKCTNQLFCYSTKLNPGTLPGQHADGMNSLVYVIHNSILTFTPKGSITHLPHVFEVTGDEVPFIIYGVYLLNIRHAFRSNEKTHKNICK